MLSFFLFNLTKLKNEKKRTGAIAKIAPPIIGLCGNIANAKLIITENSL